MSWIGLGLPFGSPLDTFSSALRVFVFRFEYLEVMLEQLWQPWGGLGCLWSSILKDFGSFVAVWVPKLLQGTREGDFLMVWVGCGLL